MDEFVKRAKQLVFLLVLLGVATGSVVLAHRSSSNDFEILESLFFAEFLISTDYTGSITRIEDEVANNIPEANYKDLVAPRAANIITSELLHDNTYHYEVTVLIDNDLFAFENREFFQIYENSIEENFDVDIVNLQDDSKTAYLSAERYAVSAAACPDITIDAVVDLQITCFGRVAV